MELEIGIVCGRCDLYSAMGTALCPSCGNDLALFSKAPLKTRDSSARTDPSPPPSNAQAFFSEPLKRRNSPGTGVRTESGSNSGPSAVPSMGRTEAIHPAPNYSQEELMEQAKNFVCRSCSTPVPMQHKFCGRCGAAVPPEIL